MLKVKVHEKGGGTKEIDTEKKAARKARRPKLMQALVLGSVERLSKRVGRIGKAAKGFPTEFLSLLDGIQHAVEVAVTAVESIPADFAPVRARRGKAEIVVGTQVTVRDKYAGTYGGLLPAGPIQVVEIRDPMVGVTSTAGALTFLPRTCVQVVKPEA